MPRPDKIAAEESRRWTAWLEGEGAALRALPLPKSVLINRAHWDDFVYEGGDAFPLDEFEVTRLQVTQAETLLAVLESYLPLRIRFIRGCIAKSVNDVVCPLGRDD